MDENKTKLVELEEQLMNDREIVLFGGGLLCKSWLDGGFDEYVNLVIDNNPEKAKKIIKNKKVVSPDEISNWGQFIIIITSNYYEEISEQLCRFGLIKGVDFVSFIDYMLIPPQMRRITEAVSDIVFEGDEDSKEILEKVYSLSEYENYCKKYSNSIRYERALNKVYQKKIGKRIAYHGYCDVCGKETDFSVDYIWTDGSMPAWRETVFCPFCGCNSRMRFMIQRISNNYIGIDSKVYICEQVTATFRELKRKIPNIIGSEFLGDTYKSGEIINEVMHQDVMNLSFDDNSLDCVASLDVYEHVPDYRKAFYEAYRCLKKNGKLMFSIPIFKDRYRSTIRTIFNDEKIEYLLPPVYHGNPISGDGSLVYTDFGWDVLETLKEVGFSEVYAVVYFSVKRGYMGELPIIIEAVK